MKINVGYTLDTRRKKQNGLYPVRYYVNVGNLRKYWSSDSDLSKDEYKKVKSKKSGLLQDTKIKLENENLKINQFIEDNISLKANEEFVSPEEVIFEFEKLYLNKTLEK